MALEFVACGGAFLICIFGQVHQMCRFHRTALEIPTQVGRLSILAKALTAVSLL